MRRFAGCVSVWRCIGFCIGYLESLIGLLGGFGDLYGGLLNYVIGDGKWGLSVFS